MSEKFNPRYPGIENDPSAPPGCRTADHRPALPRCREGRYTCAGCHGITGWKNPYPNYHVPKIGGQNFDYLVAALTEYKKGERAHPTMRVQGESLSEQDIRNVATYLSSIAP